jgi:hypothetical protein
MNCARLTSLVLLALFLVSCGSNTTAKKIDGVWTASLQNPDGSVAYTFMATLSSQLFASPATREEGRSWCRYRRQSRKSATCANSITAS